MIRLPLQAAFLLLIVPFTSWSQSTPRAVVNQPIQWFAATANLKMSKSLTGILEAQYRYASSLDPMQYQLRTGLEIRLNDHFFIVPVGYVWTENFLYGKQPAAFKNNEHRLWEQISYRNGIGRFRIDQRLRLEQRFLQVHSRTAEGDIVDEGFTNRQNRLRYRMLIKAPLGHKKSIEPHALFAVAYDEIFYSWGGTITFRQPDQNRLFAGFGYQISKPFAINAGFLYQMLIKANGAQQENNMGVQVMLHYNLNLTR